MSSGLRATLLGILCLCAAGAGHVSGGGVAPLKLDGARFVDESGTPVVLKGCNLGGWLLTEPWLVGIPNDVIRDDYQFVGTLQQRFGAERAEALMDAFRQHWISAREVELLPTFGFNLARLPFDHKLLATDDRPFTLRADAFEWLDRAAELAERAGIYLILDMHGVPGGQSIQMPSGRVGENNLWTDETAQRRLAWLWQRIAERYRERDVVIAYDLINEPYGDFRQDNRTQLVAIVDRVIAEIRTVDPDTLILAPGTARGIAFYGDPAERGWTNVGFTEHFYPGLFGQGPPTLETHARFLSTQVPARGRMTRELDVPYLAGEFNPVFASVARAPMLRRYFDQFAHEGWLATMWTLRQTSSRAGIEPDHWYLATNAQPFELPDIETATYDEIEAAFRQLSEMSLAVDDELRAALTAEVPPSLPLTDYGRSTKVTPDPPPGMRAVDIGTLVPGGSMLHGDGSVTVSGAGSDIWAARDEFHFLNRDADGDFAQRVWLTDLVAPHEHTKAGVMLRASLEPDAAHVLIHAFPDGRVMLARRSKSGDQMQEEVLAITGLPVGLGLARTDGAIHVSYTDCDGHWHQRSLSPIDSLAEGGVRGLIVGSHVQSVLAAARFQLSDVGDEAPPPQTPRENILANPSFEVVKDAANAADQAAHWDRWGHWFNRDEGWTPRRAGDCVLGYHHWQIESPADSGVYQDLTGLEVGGRYQFSVYANRDVPGPGKHGAADIELRIECPRDGRLLNVASQHYTVKDIATGDRWSRLHVTGTLPSDSARVLIIVTPSRQGQRSAALKFDLASFTSPSEE